MSYITSRPDYLSVTAIETDKTHIVHQATGWGMQTGAHTSCGKSVKEYDFAHMHEFTVESIKESFPDGKPCSTCVKKAAKKTR